MFRYLVIASLLSLATPALADVISDDLAAIAAAQAILDNDKAQFKIDKKAKAPKATLVADQDAIHTQSDILKALIKDYKADLNAIRKGISPN